MHVIYHHRTAGDRVEAVHIMGMVRPMRRLGHTVEICSPPGCDPERTQAAPAAGSAPVEGTWRHRLKVFARQGPPVLFELSEVLYNFYSLADMLRRGWRKRPDLIYERTTSNSIAPTLLARWWGIPIVQEVNVTSTIGHLRPLVLQRMTRALERWMVRRTTRFVTVSNHFKQMLMKEGFPEERILVCQNAIHPEDFDSPPPAAARPAGWNDTMRVFGYVGSFVPYHRLDLLVESARRLAVERPEVRWLLVGDGTEKPKTEELIARYGLQDRFWMLGRVKHELVSSYIQAMDAAVLPSSEQFNSPMKLFEYMAMGKAIIAPRVPAIEEVLSDGASGMLFDAGDVEGFTNAVRRVASDASLREALGRRARSKALLHHTWEQNVRQVLNSLKPPTAISASESKGIQLS